MGDILTHVSKLGLTPLTVIDVGVANGTFPLYNTFPGAFHLLVEPLDEHRSSIESILRQYNGSFVIAAAGAMAGQVELNVHADHLDGSSILKEQMGSEYDGLQRIVPMITIDSLVKDKKLKSPFVIKVDVQGFELDVMKGSEGTLSGTELVLMEVSLFKFMKGAPEIFDVISYMKRQGFVVYDIYGGSVRPLDGALGQIDMAFVKENGFFRQDHRYATSEQWQRIIS